MIISTKAVVLSKLKYKDHDLIVVDALCGTALLQCLSLSHETAERAQSLPEQTLPTRFVLDESAVAEDASRALAAAVHKACYCAAMQANLENRAALLRSVLRPPIMWPQAPLSESEREQHAALSAILRFITPYNVKSVSEVHFKLATQYPLHLHALSMYETSLVLIMGMGLFNTNVLSFKIFFSLFLFHSHRNP